MKLFARRWLKIFTALTGLIWVMIAPLAALHWEAYTAILFATATALATGTFGVPLLLLLDTIARRGLGPESVSPRQRRALLTRRSSDETFRIIERLLNGQSWIRLKANDPQKGLLVARARASLASSGERVIVEVSRLESGMTSVTMSSEPLLPITLIDFGKNWRNLERLEKLLRPQLS